MVVTPSLSEDQRPNLVYTAYKFFAKYKYYFLFLKWSSFELNLVQCIKTFPKGWYFFKKKLSYHL
jgi:hypothetical protein